MVGTLYYFSKGDPLELVHCHKTKLPNLVQGVYQVCLDMRVLYMLEQVRKENLIQSQFETTPWSMNMATR
jgi:hypothetical protein